MKRLGWLGLLGLLWTALLGGCTREGPYSRRDDRWLFEDQPVVGADAASFQPLNRVFARDKRSGYYRGVAIDSSDGVSFQALSEHDARDNRSAWRAWTYRKGQEYWAYKHQRVQRIEGADAATYRHVGEDYTADAKRVYFEGMPFAGPDPATFAVLGSSGYTHDGKSAWYDRWPIPGSDGASFAMVDASDPYHARDARRVYHAWTEINDPNRRPYPQVRVLDGASPATTRAPGLGYAVDGTRVYHRGLLLKGADGLTLEVGGTHEACPRGCDARDAGGCWQQGVRVAAVAVVPASSATR